MSNLYVSLEELDKAMSKSVVTGISLRTILRELPTINLSVIDEMIEPHSLEAFRDSYYDGYVESLEELKQRLTK